MAQSRGSVPIPVQKRTEQVELFVEQVHRRTAQGIYCLSTCKIYYERYKPKLYRRDLRAWTYFAKTLATTVLSLCKRIITKYLILMIETLLQIPTKFII